MTLIKSNMIIAAMILTALLPSLNPNAATLIVYPDGSGNYATIQAAINAAVDGDSVLLADGTFRGRSNRDIRFYGKDIIVGSLNGNAEACIIDVEGEENSIAERGFIFDNNEDSLSVLQNLTIIHGSADAPCPECEGGGVYIYYSSPKIIKIIFRDNYAATGAAISCTNGDPIIKECIITGNSAFEGSVAGIDSCHILMQNCLISDNTMDLRGGGISVQNYGVATLINCTITNNYAILGAGISAWNADYNITNSIISFNGGGASISDNEDSDFEFAYTDIFGNAGGDWIDSISGQLGINGNISLDPLLADTLSGNFYLLAGSPCINTGDPESPNDPDGSRADMGAFYFNESGIESDNSILPGQIYLAQNYPNPFNPATTIGFSIDTPTHVTLTVYDILGRNIRTLLDEDKPSGNFQVKFDASELAGGVYFYKLQAGNSSSVKIATVLK